MNPNKYDLDMNKIKELFEADWRLEQIAESMYVSTNTIYTRIKEMGLTRNDPRLLKVIDKKIINKQNLHQNCFLFLQKQKMYIECHLLKTV